MLEKFSGLRSQIKNLKDRLKALDTSKKTQKEVKEVVDALNALEERYAKEKAKRDEKRKLKETQNEKASETLKETNETREEAPKENVEDSESTPVNKESADVIPELGTDWDKVLEKKREYKPMDPAKKKEVVKNFEDKLGPAIISKYNIDEKVMPVRGEKSVGRVMRHDGPEDLVYVYWDEGPLSKRDSFGGYYKSDLVKYSEEAPKPKHPCPCWEDQSAYCPKCKSQKTSDLKSNYEEMLKDLKDEYSEAVAKADYAWVSRLEQKIKDMEAKIKEKFGDKTADVIDHPSGTERLVTIDQTPSGDKANYNQDGGTSSSEYQDELAMPSGSNRNLNAANKCMICNEEFKTWPEYNEHRLTKHKPDLVKQPTSSSTKVSAFNRDWNVTPVEKEGSYSYDVHDSEGKKVMNLKPANSKEWSTAEIKAALQHELTVGFKKARLTEDVGILKKGTVVYILAEELEK